MNNNADILAVNTFGPDGLVSRYDVSEAVDIFYVFDPLGNVYQTYDGNGNYLNSERFDAWGNPQSGWLYSQVLSRPLRLQSAIRLLH